MKYFFFITDSIYREVVRGVAGVAFATPFFYICIYKGAELVGALAPTVFPAPKLYI